MVSESRTGPRSVRPCVFQPRLPGYHAARYQADMSSGQSWTLWQRLPPRYQLTTRTVDFTDDNLDLTVTSSSPGTPKLHSSPRPKSSGPLRNSPFGPNDTEKGRRKHLQRFSFPVRRSDYVNHFQQQQRVSSARRRLAETPPGPPYQETSSERAHTAPAFPVTSPAYHTVPRHGTRPFRPKQMVNESKLFPAYNFSRYANETDTSRATVRPFEDFESSTCIDRSSPTASDRSGKRYQVQDTSEAVMYIDNGKVIYFRKSRHDLANLLKTQSIRANRNCFLADLRKDYLKHPKYESTRSTPTNRFTKEVTSNRTIVHERVDYNRRVEHILSYYSDEGEEDGGLRSRPPTPSGRSRSPKGARIKGLSLTHSAPSRPPSRTSTPSPDGWDDANEFITLNKRSKLHNRNFYLKTPGNGSENLIDMEKCKCGLCVMEMQMQMSSTRPLATGGDNEHCVGIVTGNKAVVTRKSSREKPGKGTDLADTSSINQDQVAVEKPSTRVTFQTEDDKAHDHTVKTITCTLPEVRESTDVGIGESGIDTARSINIVSS